MYCDGGGGRYYDGVMWGSGKVGRNGPVVVGGIVVGGIGNGTSAGAVVVGKTVFKIMAPGPWVNVAWYGMLFFFICLRISAMKSWNLD